MDDRPAAALKCQGVFQDGHLYAQPHHGIGFRHAVLHAVQRQATGPVNSILLTLGVIKEPIRFLNTVWGNRALIGLMNFLMWFGNTTIMLMAAIMGVDPTLYEAAELDGCTPNQMFWKITIPLIRPDPRLCDDHLDDRRSADV